MAYFTGKGYSPSTLTDITGRPLLQYQGPDDKKPYLLSDRVCPTFDFTVAQRLTLDQLYNTRMDQATSDAIKKLMGGTSNDELDHKIPLELGGSNAPANLWIEPHVAGTANTPTDPVENQLSADVQAGKISLLDAWRQDYATKGFLLGEDLKTGTTFTFTQAVAAGFKSIYAAATGAEKAQLGVDDTNLKAQAKSDLDKLKASPTDAVTLADLFTININYVAKRLNISQADATSTVVSYLANYAQSNGTDPKAVLANVNANLAKIVSEGTEGPNVFGVPSTAIVKIMTAAESVGGIAVGIGIALAIIGLFTVGWEAVGAIVAGEGILSSLLALAGASPLIAAGEITTGLGSAITFIGYAINQGVKETYDNGYLLPTQNIGAIKDALAIQKQLNKATTSSSSTSGSLNLGGVGGVSGSSVSGTGVHVSVVSGGVLGSPATFTPADKSVFESMDELQAAAEENLARYVGALPGQLAYELKLTHKIVLADGTMRIGTTQTVLHGYTKGSSKAPPRPEYKKITNKFVVADVYYTPLAGGRKKLDEVVIGAVDETGFRPTAEDLAGLGDAIAGYLVSNQLGGVTQINLPSSGAAPASKSSPSPSTVPTTTAPAAPSPAPVAPAPPATTPASLPTFTPSPPARDYPGLTDTEAALARAQGPSASTWNAAPQSSRDTWKRDFDNQLAAAAAAATATPAPATAPTPLTLTQKVAAAQTLADYYAASNTPLPSIAVEAQTYQGLGLGSASLYVGSAGQNAALLAKLKSLFA